MIVPFPDGDLISGPDYRVRNLLLEKTKSGIHLRCCRLDYPQCHKKTSRHTKAADRKILDGPLRLGPVKHVRR